MKTGYAVTAIFPLIFSCTASSIVSAFMFGRPLTGFIVDFPVSIVLIVLAGDEEEDRRRRREYLPYDPDEKITSLIKIPYFTFWLWFHRIFAFIAGAILVYGSLLVILGIIAGIFFLIGYIFSKGL